MIPPGWANCSFVMAISAAAVTSFPFVTTPTRNGKLRAVKHTKNAQYLGRRSFILKLLLTTNCNGDGQISRNIKETPTKPLIPNQ